MQVPIPTPRAAMRGVSSAGRRTAPAIAPFGCAVACALSAGCLTSAGPADTDTDGAGVVDAASEAATERGCGTARFEWGLGGEQMLPGTDCIDCHRAGGAARRVFSVAGTLTTASDCPTPASNIDVHVVDSLGQEIVVRSNAVGNFFSDAMLSPPFRTWIERDGIRRDMFVGTHEGSCNSCHHLRGWLLGYVFWNGQSSRTP